MLRTISDVRLSVGELMRIHPSLISHSNRQVNVSSLQATDEDGTSSVRRIDVEIHGSEKRWCLLGVISWCIDPNERPTHGASTNAHTHLQITSFVRHDSVEQAYVAAICLHVHDLPGPLPHGEKRRECMPDESFSHRACQEIIRRETTRSPVPDVGEIVI